MNFANIKLNIENNPRCTLECSLCKRTTYFDLNNTKNVPGIDLSLKDFKKCLDFFKGGFTFGGQLSDPIFNKDFIEMLKICKDNEVNTEIQTAATGRKESLREPTIKQLQKVGIFYDKLIMGFGGGDRILINDRKPNSNRDTAYAINLERDKGVTNANCI